MNYNRIASSWLSLGMILYPLSLVAHIVCIKLGIPSLILNIFGITDVPLLDYIISGLAGGFLFTYYLNGMRFAPLFKIKALTTAIVFEGLTILVISIFDIFTRLALLSFISGIISYGLLHGLNVIIFLIIGILVNIVFWYPFISLGNKLAINALKQKK